MKIIKHPQFKICTCVRCGTMYQPVAGDVFEYVFKDPAQFSDFDVFVRCPICEYRNKALVAPDINVGGK